MARTYSVEEIAVACRVMTALSDGIAVVDATDLEDEVIGRAADASLTALKIMSTGLQEILADHARANGPKQ